MSKRNFQGVYAHEPPLNLGCRVQFPKAKLRSVLLAKFHKKFVRRHVEGVLLQENPFYVPPDEFLMKLREKDAAQLRLRELDAAAQIQRGLMGVDTLEVPFAHLKEIGRASCRERV